MNTTSPEQERIKSDIENILYRCIDGSILGFEKANEAISQLLIEAKIEELKHIGSGEDGEV